MKNTMKQVLAGVMAFAVAADFFPTGGITVAADAAQTPVPAVTDCTGIGWTLNGSEFTTCVDWDGTGMGCGGESTTTYTEETIPVTWYDGWQDVAQDAHFRYAAENSDRSKTVLREVLDDEKTVRVPWHIDYPDGGDGWVVSVEYDGTAVKAGEGTRQRELILHDEIGWLTLYDFSADPGIADDPENYYDLFTTLTVCNPNCGFTIPQIDKIIALLHTHGLELTVRGLAGSTAEAFAKAHGLPFVELQKTVGNLTYRLYSDHASVYRFTEQKLDLNGDGAAPAQTEIAIPAEIEGLPVTEIENHAFYETSTIVSVQLPETVTRIGNSAFNNCVNLRTVNLPDSLKSIGNLAFYHTGLETVTIPDSVTDIGISVFGYCEALKAARLPAGLTAIPEELFRSCSSLETFDIPERVSVIGSEAWTGCKALKEITFPEQLTVIGQGAFGGTGLTAVEIPESCTEIGEGAFKGCRFLRDVKLPDGMKELRAKTFAVCDSLKEIVLPEGLKSIGEEAFDESGVASVQIPDSCTEIGAHAFAGCDNLKEIRLPKNLTELSEYLFGDCDRLETVLLPDGLKVIGGSAFCDCAALRSIAIPDTVTAIESFAFSFCTELTQIQLPASLEMLGGYVFNNCTALEKITVPASVQQIEAYCFDECSALSEITFLADECEISSLLFGMECSQVVTICGNADSAVQQFAEENYYVFRSLDGSRTIEPDYEKALLMDVREDGAWVVDLRDEVPVLTVPSEYEGHPVVGIAENAFQQCYRLGTVILPETLKTIGNQAFWHSGIRNITLPEGLTTLGANAFEYCEKLESVILPESLTVIPREAFFGCGIQSVQIPDTVTEIGDFAFASSSLTEVHLPASVETIGWRAFALCRNMRSFTAENSSCKIKEIFGDPDYDDREAVEHLTIYGAKDSELHAYADWMKMPFCTTDGERVTEPAATVYQPSEQYYELRAKREELWEHPAVTGTDVYYDDPDITTSDVMYTTTANVMYTTTQTTCTTVTTTAGTSADAQQKKLPGDLDQNGRLSIADAVLLARLAAEDQMLKLSEAGRSCADIDGDGEITASDITTLLLWVNRS